MGDLSLHDLTSNLAESATDIFLKEGKHYPCPKCGAAVKLYKKSVRCPKCGCLIDITAASDIK